MPNEIYHRSNWGESKAEDFGDVYYDHAATNKLYNHSDYYENSDGTDATLKDLNNKASIVLTPTAYSDGSLNTVIPPYAPSYIENVAFVTSEWSNLQESWSIDETNNKLVAEATWTGFNKSAQYPISETLVGKTVKFSFDAVVTAGKFHFISPFSSGNVGYGSPNYINQSGSYSFTYVATGSSVRFRNKSTDFAGEITNIRIEVIEEADFDFSRGSSATRVNEQGLVEDVQILSGELVQNGNFEQIGSEISNDVGFNNPSNWTLTGQSTVSNGKAHIVQSDSSNTGITSSTNIINKTYKITGVVSDYVSGSVGFASLGSTNPRAAIPSQNGAFTIYYTSTRSTPSTWNIQRITSPCDLKLDNVSVKEVGQNWTISGDNFSIVDSALRINRVTNTTFIQQNVLTSGKKYKVEFDVLDKADNSGNFTVRLGSNNVYSVSDYEGTKFSKILTSSGTDFRIYSSSNNGVIYVDNVSVKEITDDTDLPRIDFTDGTGSLLLEPQRTNSVPYSNDFSQHALTGGSITSDDIVSPDGSVNADTFAEDTNNSQHKIREDISVTLGTYTMSCFVKGTDRFISFYPQGISTAYAVFDIANENVTASGGSDYVSSDIQNYGSGWYRCSLTYNVDTGTSYTHIYLSNSSTNPSPTYTGNGSEMSFYGLQLEAGDYPTSYIPTSGSTVTRSADIANNSGNADLFNDSEGVLYAEIKKDSNALDNAFSMITIGDALNNRLQIALIDNSNDFDVLVGSSSGTNNISSAFNYGSYNKIALSYNSSGFKVFHDGTLVGSDSNTISGLNLQELKFRFANNTSYDFYGDVKCVAVFKEALSNDLLERLTGEGYESFRLLAEANNYTII